MKVNKLQNGQYVVINENLTLTQTIIKGERFNDCTVSNAGFIESCRQHDERFKPLFIALHNFKSNE